MNARENVSFGGHRTPAPRPEPRRGHILIIDDEPLFATAMQRCLALAHDVVSTNSADEALRLLARGTRFDLIFCDLMMPDMNGMEFYAALTAHSREHAMRTVFLTGGAFTPEVREFLESVPNPCLEKPFDVQQLIELAREWIGFDRPDSATGDLRSA